jgi:hypothetical protein
MTKRKQTGKPDPLDYRKRIRRIAEKVGSNLLLSDDEKMYLVNALSQVAEGDDANAALGVKFGHGQSQKAALLRQNMNIIMHMLAALVAPESDMEFDGPPMKLIKACEMLTPIAQRLAGDDDEVMYDPEYLLKYWHENQHLHSIWRTADEPGSPYC